MVGRLRGAASGEAARAAAPAEEAAVVAALAALARAPCSGEDGLCLCEMVSGWGGGTSGTVVDGCKRRCRPGRRPEAHCNLVT